MPVDITVSRLLPMRPVWVMNSRFPFLPQCGRNTCLPGQPCRDRQPGSPGCLYLRGASLNGKYYHPHLK
jgi:hypothetical protein